MADITASHVTTGRAFGLKAFAARLFDAMVRIGESDRRLKRLECLSALSDAELARRGLKREQLAAYVFPGFL